MTQSLASPKLNSKNKATSNEYHLLQRESSQGRNSSSSKFLKRKPDHKKIMMGSSSKKKRESSMSQYFEISSDRGQTQPAMEIQMHSQIITDNKENKSQQKNKTEGEEQLLESGRSQGNLFLRKKELGVTINKVYEVANKISKDSFISSNSKGTDSNIDPNEMLISKIYEIGRTPQYQRTNSKKSKTEFFHIDQLANLDQHSDIYNKDSQQSRSTREYGDLSQQYLKFKNQCEALSKKNKWLEEQIEYYTEQEYLLQTEKKHIEQMLKEKDRIIDRLQREKGFLILKGRAEVDHESDRFQEEIASLKNQLAKEEQRNQCLKEESEFIQNQLINKNEDLIAVYDQYTVLESSSRKEQERMKSKLQKMKVQIEKMKKQSKAEVPDYGPLNQSQKWKEKCFKLQEEKKYLQIQNQCLLITKDELFKSENQNRKLRDERDYFKKKVMQNIKRNKHKMRDFSHSESSSIVLELSETSMQKK